MSQPVVAITHPADKIATFFPDTDLQILEDGTLIKR